MVLGRGPQLDRTLLRLLMVVAVAVSRCSHSSAAYYPIDGAQLGQPFHSVGAQSTAGTARLLVDYPSPQREQVLDLLFKPQYGASLQHLKVEVGGDAQISCGAEPSPMRASPSNSSARNNSGGGGGEPADDGVDFSRGYEHWLMSEAKKRNPDIILLGLVYAWPSWVSPSGHTPYDSPTTEQNAATYMANWVSGVKASHNLTIDWVGCWNEQRYTKSYIKTLRRTLDAHGHSATQIVASDRNWEPIASDYLEDAELRAAVGALTQHYPHCDASGGAPGTGATSVACF